MLWFFSAFLTYIYSLYNIGNTIYRKNHENIYTLQFGVIFETIIAPMRVFRLINQEYGYFWFLYDYKLTKKYLDFFLHLSNPFFVFPLFYFIYTYILCNTLILFT
jgi:hypothetical protein